MRELKATTVVAALIVCCTVGAAVAADDNPLGDVFPYGVYIGGNNPDGTVRDIRDVDEVRKAIERACRDVGFITHFASHALYLPAGGEADVIKPGQRTGDCGYRFPNALSNVFKGNRHHFSSVKSNRREDHESSKTF